MAIGRVIEHENLGHGISFEFPSRLREGLGEGSSGRGRGRKPLPRPLPQAGGEFYSESTRTISASS
ncbi:MAG: hypothetical protein EOP66_16595 [Sphingomonas sp.]|nr:MAG: hypothetical protein EOP66_16595 [Sphingomonas sp.]